MLSHHIYTEGYVRSGFTVSINSHWVFKKTETLILKYTIFFWEAVPLLFKVFVNKIVQ